MSGDPKLNLRDTFVLDPDTIDELDEMSLTSVIRDFEVSADSADDEANASAGGIDQNKSRQSADAADADDDEPFELTLMDD